MEDEKALARVGESSPATGPQEFLALLGEGVKGKTCPQRIIEILTVATRERKIVWVRDAAWYAICLVPFLAVSFRIKFPQDPKLTAEWPAPGIPGKLDIVFMDGTKDITLLPGAGFIDQLEDLGNAVRQSFRDGYQRDRNERLEFLEAALRQFLPMVVSSDPREG